MFSFVRGSERAFDPPCLIRLAMQCTFVVMLAGAVLFVAGPAVLRLVLFPLAFLLLMIPLPASLPLVH